MLALLASLLLVAYVIVPGVVFRVVFSWFVPLRAFDRTRTVEFAYSAVVCALPFAAALVVVHHTGLGRWPWSFQDTWIQGAADYKTILLSCFSEPFASPRDEFWNTAVRSSKRLSRLLFWYSALVVIEASALGFLASKWGAIQPKLAKHAWADRLFTRILLRNISEWHVLLTNFLFPGTTIHVDVLTTDDHLYQGDVLDYTRDRDGNLTGIYLDNAQRYDRTGLLTDRAVEKAKPSAEYWRVIPGKRLFIFADKISTLNVRPQTTMAAASELARQLDPAATVTVRSVAESAPRDSSVAVLPEPAPQAPRTYPT